MSSLTSVENISPGEDFNPQNINRPHRDLAVRDEELLSYIRATSGGDVYSGYNSRVSINCVATSGVVILENTSVSSDDGSVIMTADSDFTVSLGTSGVANGLDTGEELSERWYYIYMIRKAAEDTEAGLMSESYTSPTLPTDYVYKRLIGAVRNDFSSDFILFHQTDGEVIYYDDSNVLITTSSPATSYSALNCSGYIPAGLNSRMAIIKSYLETGDHERRVWTQGSGIDLGFNNLVASVYKYEDPAIHEFFQIIDSSREFSYKAEYSTDWSTIHGYAFTMLVYGYIFAL